MDGGGEMRSEEGMKRGGIGIPPSHPNHHLPPSSPFSRSSSQPPFFSLSQLHASDLTMETLPPRRGHRRSSSDIPLGFNAMIHSSPQFMPIGSREIIDVETPFQFIKSELEGGVNGNENKSSQGEIVDDLFNAYMNLDILDAFNTTSASKDKGMDSRASGAKTNGGENSDNEVESRVNGHTNGLHGVKRCAGGDIAPTSRHFRSVSMDSFMGNLQFDDESSKLPPQAGRVGQHSPSSSMDGSFTKFNLDLANGEFTGGELQKIMANDKLAEIALSDPKRAKRILANRQSAARSKERKMRYIVELEHKVQTLQTEATTLSAQLAMLQRDSTGLTSENNELKFRLQSIGQQAQLKDALNEALTAEVRHLKSVVAEYGGETHLSNCMVQQLSINQQMYQLQNHQSNQLNTYQLQQHKPQHDLPQGNG